MHLGTGGSTRFPYTALGVMGLLLLGAFACLSGCGNSGETLIRLIHPGASAGVGLP